MVPKVAHVPWNRAKLLANHKQTDYIPATQELSKSQSAKFEHLNC